ncbi:MAG: HAD family hydrolase [Pirellulales bacterium]|nr:HAD family hydrolase [Pirellulales bacterium]
MLRAILFDLDDTLYCEGDFYRSGFAVVSCELQRRSFGRAEPIRRLLEHLHFHGDRERVFNDAAERIGFPAEWVPELVLLFHRHTPAISLPVESADVLKRLRHSYRLGIVTDGHGDVQRRKLSALGVVPLVDAVVVTDDLGREYWKPHPLPFQRCCERLSVDPSQAIYVGDNPDRDMAGACRAGMSAVRIRRPDGYFRDHPVNDQEMPCCEIRRLADLEIELSRHSPRPGHGTKAA